MEIPSATKGYNAYGKIRKEQLKDEFLTKEDLQEIESRIAGLESSSIQQEKYSFDESMSYMEIKYKTNRPNIQVFVYTDDDTENAVKSNCSVYDKDSDTLIVSWQGNYKGFILATNIKTDFNND